MNKIFLTFLILLTLFSACKSRKNLVKTPDTVVLKNDSTIKIPGAADLLGFTLKSWTYFSSRIDANYTKGEDSKNVNVNIRMLRDSLVWISGGLFGIEGVRVLINKDSMVIINKLERSYTVLDRGTISNITGVPLTVSQIQNLIIAKPVYALDLYNILVDNNNRLAISSPQGKMLVSHRYNKQFYTIDSTSVKDLTGGSYAIASYSNYSVIDGHNFPMKSVIDASNTKSTVKISLDFEDVDFTSIQTFPFTIPGSYERK